MAASLRYLNQRYTMPTGKAKALLTDIGTEEMAHLEVIAAMVYQLMRGASVEQLKAAGLAGHYADHDKALFYVDANGNPFTVTYIQAKGDPITDLHEDMAAEQKARSTYEWLINLSDDPCVIDPLRFLREREVVHFQRFGEALMDVQEYCKYCVIAHSMFLRKLGVSEEVINKIVSDIDSASISEDRKQILKFTIKSSTVPNEIIDKEVTELMNLGLTDAQLVEIVSVVDLFTSFNKFLDTLQVDLDF